MTEEFDKTINIFFEFQKMKIVHRYGSHDPIYHENVASHYGTMIAMADELIERFKLNLDFKKVIQLIKYHDMSEIGMIFDFDAMATESNIKIQKEKTVLENKTINNFSKEYGLHIKRHFQEYESQQTNESRFVKIIDRLDAWFRIMERGVDKINNEWALWTTSTADEFARKYQPIVPFYIRVRELLVQQLKERKGIIIPEFVP
ncbi:MAG: HD domain-containing protein [Firmicutes bacterium]|nr:HD domain-containing protein [Bacillota bacterium]